LPEAIAKARAGLAAVCPPQVAAVGGIADQRTYIAFHCQTIRGIKSRKKPISFEDVTLHPSENQQPDPEKSSTYRPRPHVCCLSRVLEDDLLRDVLEALLGRLARMREDPATAPAEDACVTKQERQNLLVFLAQVCRRTFPRPHQVEPPHGPHPGPITASFHRPEAAAA